MLKLFPGTLHQQAAFAASHSTWATSRRGGPQFAWIKVGHLQRTTAGSNEICPTSRTHDADAIWQLPHNVEVRLSSSAGDIVIKPITKDVLHSTADLLTEVYFQTYNLLPYKRYLRYQIQKYLQQHMALPKALILVALLEHNTAQHSAYEQVGEGIDNENSDSRQTSSVSYQSTSAASNPAFQSETTASPVSPSPTRPAFNFTLPWSQPTTVPAPPPPPPPTVVGTAELSFCPTTRTRYPGLDPPDDCAFLCNMAVAPEYRRKGIASSMLEAAAQVAGPYDMYLHVRCQDNGARKLYEKNGFRVEREDNIFVSLLGRDRKRLMRRLRTSQ